MDSAQRQRVLEACRRFVEAIAGRALPETFAEREAWSMIPGLASRRRAGVELPEAAVRMLPELAGMMGIAPGGTARTIAAAMVGLLGECPHSNELLLEAAEYLRGQVNGGFGGPPPDPSMLGF
jgi:hypothetical protein